MADGPSEIADGRLRSLERARLEELEVVIDEGLATFIKVGSALREIRDQRLYRESHDSFEAYCRVRWGLSRHWAYRQINAADVTRELRNGDNCQHPPRLPANEAQARPLTSTSLDPDDVRQAWSLALDLSDGAQPTSRDVEKALDMLAAEDPAPRRDESDDSVHFSSECSDWRSPPDLVAKVMEVLGEITLDPCAASRTAPTVSAEEHFTREHDGLDRVWFGKVYVNPPYGQEIGRWVDKLVREYEEGNVEELVCLLPARTDTAWFRRLRRYPRCFLHGRLTFSGHEHPAPFPSMTVYLGDNGERFSRVFADVGDIYVAVDTLGS